MKRPVLHQSFSDAPISPEEQEAFVDGATLADAMARFARERPDARVLFAEYFKPGVFRLVFVKIDS